MTAHATTLARRKHELRRLRSREPRARVLAEARRLFAQMGVTGWDGYARSIEA